MAKGYGGKDSTITKKTVVFVPLKKKETDEEKERRMANAPTSNEEKIRKHGMPKIMASPTLPSVAYDEELKRRAKKRDKNL